MIQPNQDPSHEQREQTALQQFDGAIADEVTRVGYNTLTTPVLTAELNKKGDQILIPGDAESPVLGYFNGSPIIAKLELGGGASGDRGALPDSAIVVRVDEDKQTDDMAHMLRSVLRTKWNEQSGPTYLVVNGTRNVKNFTVVRPGSNHSCFGRHQNNMDWFDSSGEPIHYDPKGQVTGNLSVSKFQLTFAYGSDDLRVIHETNNSKTVVRTVATKAHQLVLEERAEERTKQELGDSKTPQRKKVAKVLGSFIRK